MKREVSGMHTGSMSETEGDFDKAGKDDRPCRKCGAHEVTYRVWESSCGGYEDVKYTCGACGRGWWVEGSDS